jgi:hypothetical protein
MKNYLEPELRELSITFKTRRAFAPLRETLLI